MKGSTRNTSAINPVTMKSMDDSQQKHSYHCSHLVSSSLATYSLGLEKVPGECSTVVKIWGLPLQN